MTKQHQCKFPVCQNEEYQQTIAEQIKRELYTGEQPAQQEPVAWTPIDQPYPPGGELDILMGDGSILCEVLPQSDGDLWWGGASTGERFIDPKYASVTHWRIHAEHTSPPAQRTWVGLTDEERDDILDIYITAEGRARAIEHKLKEKNT